MEFVSEHPKVKKRTVRGTLTCHPLARAMIRVEERAEYKKYCIFYNETEIKTNLVQVEVVLKFKFQLIKPSMVSCPSGILHLIISQSVLIKKREDIQPFTYRSQ